MSRRFSDAEILHRFPILREGLHGDESGTGVLIDPLADQIEHSLDFPHRLVENYHVVAGRGRLSVHLAESRLRKFAAIADDAKRAYDREFSSPARYPRSEPTGYTHENGSSIPDTPDTRVYTILARYPFERTPITSQIEFNNFARHAESQLLCDLRMFGPSCDAYLTKINNDPRTLALLSLGDYAGYPKTTAVPIVRADVIVWVHACFDCWKYYCRKHGIIGGEIVDPNDVIE